MGYFVNGTEGSIFEEKYCVRCRHFDPENACPVMMAHDLYNYDQHDNEELKSVLGLLISRGKNGFTNKCNMFIELEAEDEQ